MAERGRGFAPVVLAGVAAGALAAVAGTRTWATADGVDDSAGGAVAEVAVAVGQGTAPLVTALGLVLLACWGVVLVSRGRFRRGTAWLGALAAVALFVAAVATWVAAPREVADAFEPYGVTGVQADRTAWAWLGVLAGVGAVLAAFAAVRGVGSWPEMGRRYDAPGAQGAASADRSDAAARPPAEDRSNLDLWRSIDEGDDPTA